MSNELFCTSCGAVGKPRVRNRGSSAIEIILWLCFIVPGLFYTLWRMGRKDRFCRSCQAPQPDRAQFADGAPVTLSSVLELQHPADA